MSFAVGKLVLSELAVCEKDLFIVMAFRTTCCNKCSSGCGIIERLDCRSPTTRPIVIFYLFIYFVYLHLFFILVLNLIHSRRSKKNEYMRFLSTFTSNVSTPFPLSLPPSSLYSNSSFYSFYCHPLLHLFTGLQKNYSSFTENSNCSVFSCPCYLRHVKWKSRQLNV